MRKRVTALLLTMVLLVSLLPMPAAAVSESERAQIRSAVEKVVKAYGKKVYQADSADDAFSDFFYHGFFGNGRKMVLKESDPMVAALFNAGVMQEALTETITEAISHMLEVGDRSVLATGGPSWHNYYYSYFYSGYVGEKEDVLQYLGTLSSSAYDYGFGNYPGVRNRNDEVMELLVGALESDIIIKEVRKTATTSAYRVEIYLHDSFDFTGDYNTIANKGFDTTVDESLKNLGFLLTYMGLDEFKWEYRTTFELEVASECEHRSGAFCWQYDPSAREMHSVANEEYTENTAARCETVNVETGEINYNYRLSDMVVLRHNMPWVVEYDTRAAQNLILCPLKSTGSRYPFIYQVTNSDVWVMFYEYGLDKDDKVVLKITYYVGVKITYKGGYKSNHLYTYRLENRVAEDGSNMIWFSVYDNDTDEMVFEPTAMDHYWTKTPDGKERIPAETTTDRVNGTDLRINYLGSSGNGIRHTKLEIRIWEKGKNAADNDIYRAPTCDKAGGNVRICEDCGGEVISDMVPALGHDYGEYVSDNNASCVTDGTKTAVCSRCGDKKIVTVPDTALGHSYGEYVSDNNAGCVTDATETATCSACGHKTTRTVAGTAKGHNHISVTVKPTCTEVGYRNHLCRCGDEYRTDEVPALGHTPVTDAAVAATCITKGLTEGSHCEVCDAVIVAQQETATVGHTWDQGVITVEPTPDRGGTIMYTCIHCGVKDYFSVQYTEKVQFEDVSDDDYFADAVAWAAEQNITTGIGEGLFGPNEGCTRGQVVTFLWRAAGEPMPTATENPFEDVRENDFFYTAVLWAVENGITTGAGEGRFDPDSTCTRGQIVTFLWRTFGKEAAEIENPFTDVENSAFYRDAVLWCVEGGITTGVNSEKFAPEATCTRGQVVTFLYRAMK